MLSTVIMKITIIFCLFLQIQAEIIKDEDEKVLKVWEDRIQHAELDADEVNFPLLNTENVEEAASDAETADFEFNFQNKNEKYNTNHSIITFFHKITTNNVTRQGVTTMPSSHLMPLLKTALASLSGESLGFLALAGMLPLIAMFVPLMVMALVVPIIFAVSTTIMGVVAGSFVFLPLILFGTGLFSAIDFTSFDKMSDWDFSQLEHFPSLEEIERIDEIMNMDIENITSMPMAEESTFELNNNNVPRFLY